MKYRADITGLRAIAVLPVILFHAGIGGFEGGYLGVDIFFVISGFLITGIVLRDIEDGAFRFRDFYKRRARRLLPALYVMLAATVPFALVSMPPEELASYGRALLATILFISNVHFWENVGYFALDAEKMPLLHTWSLAVEEQYYLIFPTLLIIFARWGRRAVLGMSAVLLVLSVLLNEWGLRNEPEINFFFTLSRFWELLAGSVCAILVLKKPRSENQALSLLGLILVLAALFVPQLHQAMTSIPLMLTVIGTVLILRFSGASTAAGRALSLAPFVWIGLISYSVYLWHQPLLALARLFPVREPSAAMMLAVSSLSLLIGWASYAFIEQPMRHGRWPLGGRSYRGLTLGLGTSAVLGAVGLGLFTSGGLPMRLDERAQNWAADTVPTDNRAACLFDKDKGLSGHPFDACQVIVDGQAPRVMLLGDSHANAVSPALQIALEERGIGSYAVAYSGCVPLPDMFRVDKARSHRCMDFNDAALDYARSAAIDTLVLSARFTLYWDGHRYVNGEGGHEPGGPQYIDIRDYLDMPGGLDDAGRRDRVLEAYVAHLSDLAKEFRIILVGPIPEAGWNVPNTLVKLAIRGSDAERMNLTTSAAEFDGRNGRISELFAELQASNLTVVSPRDTFCDTFVSGRCINDLEGEALYVDDDHLSFAGAALLAEPIADAVEDALQ